MSVSLRKADEEQQPPLFAGLHGSFFASDVRQGEHIECWVRKSKETERHTFSVWRISPFGIELVADERCHLVVQQAIELSLRIAGHEAKYRGCVVGTNIKASSMTRAEETWRKHGKSTPLVVAIRLETTPPLSQKQLRPEPRGESRWACHHLFFPTGTLKNTSRLDGRVAFRVIDFSASGMQIAVFAEQLSLTAGLWVSVELNLPSVGRFGLDARIAWAKAPSRQNEKEAIFGLSFHQQSDQVRHAIGQYILQFGGDAQHRPTPQAMRDSGFAIYSVSEQLEFDVVRSDDDYRQVLQLRSRAASSSRQAPKIPTGQMADLYDTRARILMCKFRGHVVGSVRLSFHGPNDQFEEETHAQLPLSFPAKDLVVDASRASAHPDFRGSNIPLLLMRYTLLLTLQAQRRYVVQRTFAALVPTYRRMGFRDTGVRTPHPSMPDKSMHLLILDVQKTLESARLGPVIWCALFPHLLKLIATNKSIRLGWMTRQRLRWLRFAVPFVTMYERINGARRRLQRKQLR